MRVLVAGGTGFIPAWIIRELRSAGHEAAAFDLREPGAEYRRVLGAEEENVPFYQGDVTDAFSLSRAAAAFGPDALVHMVAITALMGDRNPVWSAHVNLRGFLNCFELARSLGLRRVVYASSSAVFKGYHARYGGSGEPTPSTMPLNPMNVYGTAKAFYERTALHYWRRFGISSVGTRFGVILGPGRAMYQELLEKPALGRPGRVPFGNESSEWVTVMDAARAVRMACETEKWGDARVYSVAGNYAPVRTAVEVVRSILPEARIELDLTERWEPWQQPLDPSLSKEELGFAPQFDNLEGLFRHLINEVRQENGLPPIDGAASGGAVVKREAR
jgi:nucleoside-diphosphate-sugar epimerase